MWSAAGAPWRGRRQGSTAPGRRTARDRLAARTERAGGRVVVRLDFTLPVAGRLYLVVRGPYPSCRAVGTIPVRGRAGKNTVRFAGRIGSRPLDPGVYVLTLAATRTAPAGPGSEAVRVVSPHRTVPLPERREPACDAATAASMRRFLRLLDETARTDAALLGAARQGRTDTPRAPLLPPSVSEVAGEVTLADEPAPPALADGDGRSALESVAAVLVVAGVGFLLVMMLTLVTRFIRGSWDP